MFKLEVFAQHNVRSVKRIYRCHGYRTQLSTRKHDILRFVNYSVRTLQLSQNSRNGSTMPLDFETVKRTQKMTGISKNYIHKLTCKYA